MYDLLGGMRVVEAAAFVAAPSCALHLAQFGAEVIRIDTIGGGPDFHRWPLAANGASFYWEGLNKGKKSIALDLTRPEGRELAVRIITAPGANAGLLVTNYPADGFLSYESLRKFRHDLICIRIMGWPDGRTAVDYTVNASFGVPAMTGPPEDPRPVNHVLPAWDLLTGAYAAFSLLAAERLRKSDGSGREIRIPLADVALASLGHLGQIAEVLVSGQDRPRLGNQLYGAFGRDFHTLDGKRLMVVAITPRQWRGLLQALGLQERVNALERELGVRFDRHEGPRFEHRERLIPLIERAVAARTAAQLGAVFTTLGVCWSPYQTLREAMTADPGPSSNNPLFAVIDHPSGHRYAAPGAAATLPSQPRQPPVPAARLGRDTDEVLADLLQLSGEEIGRLHDAGVVAN
jgi:2-methylfumaryl-CoA isomerase